MQDKTRQCIYCLERKPTGCFNTDHVLQKAFGKFKGNLTIECVCKDCNGYFGDNFELALGRDTVEGFERFRRGLKPVSEYKHLGKKARSVARINTPGPTYGAIAFPHPNPAGSFDVGLASQIGFSLSEEGHARWFEIDRLPTWDELRNLLGVPPGENARLYVRGLETALEAGKEALAAKGFPLESFVEIIPPNALLSTGQVQVEHSFPIGRPQFRAIGKIALNYVARVFGPHIALMPEFDVIRRFVRYAEPVPPNTIGFSRSDQIVKFAEDSRDGHYILVKTIRNRLLANVSIFCELDYQIWLTSVPFLIDVGSRDSAHLFDLRAKKVYQLTRDPLGKYLLGRPKRK